MKIEESKTNKLSHYRTMHEFKHFGEINSLEDLKEYCSWAKENKVKIYILGNGSNTLFVRKKITSLVLKNKLPKFIKPLDGGRVEVSSSTQLMEVLKYCQKKSLNSFYYLSSVPATIGGALAMNAGRGRLHKATIYDFVESVTFYEEGSVRTLHNDQIERSYRTTPFTGKHSKLIISCVLKFRKEEFSKSPIQERQFWAKGHQDNTAPNCGSVFKAADFRMLKIVQGLSIGRSCFSKKTKNWILNYSENSKNILILIKAVKIMHFLFGKQKKLALEIIEVD